MSKQKVTVEIEGPRFKVIPYVYMGGGLIQEVDVTTDDLKRVLGIKIRKADYARSLKYSEDRIVVEDTVTKQQFRLYTSFGQWRIGSQDKDGFMNKGYTDDVLQALVEFLTAA